MTQLAEPLAILSDGELLAEFSACRDESAFAEIVRRHGGMVLAVCRCVLGNAADAEDAAQAAFLTLAQKSSSRRVQRHLVGWLYRVAWYVAARAAQARAIRRRHEQEAARMKPEAPSQADDISADLIHAGLVRLPEKYRVPLLLFHLEGRSLEETAALLGCSISAVAMRLNRGRQMLRERLARRERQPALTASALLILLGRHAAPEASPGFVARAARSASLAAAGRLSGAALASNTAIALSRGAMRMPLWAKLGLAMSLGVLTACLARPQAGAAKPVAEAATRPTTARAIYGPVLAFGSVTSVTDSSVTVVLNGTSQSVPINTSTLIVVDGKAVGVADLKVGALACARGSSGRPATRIKVLVPRPAETASSPPPPPEYSPS